MDSKRLQCTVLSMQTSDAKGGRLIVKMEFADTPENAAYISAARKRNSTILLEPGEMQKDLDFKEDTNQNVIEFPDGEQKEPEVNEDDQEEMDTDFEEATPDEAETGSMPDLDDEDPESEDYQEEDLDTDAI